MQNSWRWLTEHVELWLASLLVLAAWLLPAWLPAGSNWRQTILIGTIIQISLMLVVYWRRRKIRRDTIRETRNMLRDNINNQLTIIAMNASASSALLIDTHEAQERISDAVATISQQLETLSDDSLLEWRDGYEKTFADLEKYMDR